MTRSIVPCQQLVLPRTPRQESDHYARLSNRGRRSLGLPFSDRLSAGVLFGLGRVRIFLTLEPEPKPIHVALLRGSKHARWKHIAQVPDGSRSRSSVIGVYYLKLSTFLIALTQTLAAHFKRPYRNCPDRTDLWIPAFLIRGSPDRNLSFVVTDP